MTEIDPRERTVGQRVRKYREAQGYSLTDLARASGVSRSYLYQVESGESSPTEEKLVALARALGVSASDLLGESAEVSDVPRELAEFAREKNLQPDDVRMLSRISYRGKRPTTREGWEALFSVIKAVSKAEE